MATSAEYLQSVTIPVLGLCVLLPLFMATIMEQRRDFSRKIYFLMLASCTGLLVTEAVEWLSDGRAVGFWVGFFQFTQCIFYVMLVLLCFLWSVYSYYWFNKEPPRRRVVALLAAGPIFALCFLVINLFTGIVYSIGADAVYARGSAFSFFIFFCYLYLIIAITVTASRAMTRNGGGEGHDFRLFLMFFVFPAIGPILQYVFANIPVMGISEAIALLAIYVSVQQRANAQYAVEMARFQDANRRYDESLERLLSVDPNALSAFHLDLTNNSVNDIHGNSMLIGNLMKGSTVDDLFATVTSCITDERDADAFAGLFSRSSLLDRFADDDTQVSLVYHRSVDNGESHAVRTSLSMLANPSTNDVEAIAYSVDVDRQENEEKVISVITSREYDYIALIDSATRRIHFQQSAGTAAGSVGLDLGDYTEVIGRMIANVYEPKDRAHLLRRVSLDTVIKKLEKQREYSITSPCRAPSGELLQKKTTFQYLDDSKAEILFFRNDITEETRQEREHSEALQKALLLEERVNRTKSEFLSNVSHDMRTPLNAVLGYVGIAKQADTLEETKTYLDKIDKAGNLLLTLVNDTLDLSKIETGVIILKPFPVRCSEISGRIITAVRPMMDEHHIHFVFDDSRAAKATVNVDAPRLQDVFVNLLSNAAKFTPEGGTVTLTVECTKLENNVVHDRITVSDTGCGMSPEFVPKMFEPFAQENPASAAGAAGSGLGLTVVKRLVDMMGGTIDVRSTQGKGTDVAVSLDLERVNGAQENPMRARRVDLIGRHVLLAEDNAMNTEVARAMLERRGAKVTCVENGNAACDAFSGSVPGSFDAILMDLRMPVMDGREATRVIRAMHRPDAATIPIIAVSADAFDDDIHTSLEAGMNSHISKPIDPDTLFGTLGDLLGLS